MDDNEAKAMWERIVADFDGDEQRAENFVRNISAHHVFEEGMNEVSWWWLSFATETEFLGGVFLQAKGMVDAVAKSHRLGLNPGGSVMTVSVPDGKTPPEHLINRLLTKEEAEEEF